MTVMALTIQLMFHASGCLIHFRRKVGVASRHALGSANNAQQIAYANQLVASVILVALVVVEPKCSTAGSMIKAKYYVTTKLNASG